MKSYIFFFYILMIPAIVFGQKDSTKLFEPKQIKADIDTLICKLKDIHPSFLNYYKSNNIEIKVDSIKNTINKPISALDFFRLMQPIVAIDGHTSLNYNGPLCSNEENPLFPFKVIVFENTLYIKENLSKDESIVKASIIEEINGISSEKIINNLIKYIPGEKESFKKKKLEKDFHIYMALVYGSFSTFNITINKTEYALEGARWSDFSSPSKPKFELRFYDDDIAYIYKRMFMPPRDFISFMDSAFNVISEKQIDYLIIDNLSGGGLTDLADSLMSYFTDKPYNMLEKQVTKISPSTKDYIENKKTEGYIQDGYFIQEYSKHNSPRKNRFTGTIFILTGALSYSTATSFPAAAKCYQNAFVVGEETGQPLVSNGGQDRFMLPETKMVCITALSKVYMPCHNNDEINGVLPDYTVTPTIEDLLMDTEYILEYTLDLIRKKRK
jgi:C-terminal processing protease CtpA/Prc